MDTRKRRKTDITVAGEYCRRFGATAVRKGFVTLEQLKSAVLLQIDDDVNGRGHRLLGSILSDQGLLAEDQIAHVLREMQKTLR